MKKALTALVLMAISAAAVAGEYLIPARNTGRWGYIDRNGAWIIPARYAEALSFSEGLAAVKFYDKWGYIDRRGDWVIEPVFWDAKSFSEGLACAWSDNGWGYIDRQGNWHIQPSWSMVSSFEGGRALVKTDDGYRFIDRMGKTIHSTSFQKALPFSEGMAFVIYGEQQGYIDRNGNWIIRNEFDEAYSFSDGRALVRKGLYYGFIDQQGQVIIQPRYQDATFFREGLAAVKYGGYWAYIDTRGETVISPAYDQAFPFSDGLAVVKKNGLFGLIDREGKWVLTPAFSGLGRHSLATDLREEIERHVRTELANWLLKGEYEKTTEYLDRISIPNREKVTDSLVHAAIQENAALATSLEQARLGHYNADMECFELIIPGAPPVSLSVPRDEAPALRDYWQEIAFGKAEWQLSGYGFELRQLDLIWDEKVYSYDRGDQAFDEAFAPAVTDLYTGSWYSVPPPGHNFRIRGAGIAGQSDVDSDIPLTSQHSPNTFALIIGNEDYSSYHPERWSEIRAEYAAIDARIFREYAIKTMGIPEENITMLINATAGQMRQALGRLSAIAKAFAGEAHLLVYYAGHGLPHPLSREPYLLPVDINGSDLSLAIGLQDLYAQLTEHPSRRVTVFMDACFSGPSGQEGLMASRGIRIRPKSPLVLGNLIVFTASSGEQAAYPYREKAHGMFTYYLLKALQTSAGRISYGELADYLQTQVPRSSILVNDREQEPRIEASPVFGQFWTEMRLYESGFEPGSGTRP